MIWDKYNNLIEVGDLVAFNYSGTVCLGNIKEIKASKRYGKPCIKFIIKHIRSRDVSTVMNIDNLCAIRD